MASPATGVLPGIDMPTLAFTSVWLGQVGTIGFEPSEDPVEARPVFEDCEAGGKLGDCVAGGKLGVGDD